MNETAADFMPILKLRPAYHQNMARLRDCCQKVNDFNAGKVKDRKSRLEKEGYDDPQDFIEFYLKVREFYLKGKILYPRVR